MALQRDQSIKHAIEELYEQRIKHDALDDDSAQRHIVRKLDEVLIKLTPSPQASKHSSLGWLFNKRPKANPIKGLYIWGDVGRGKTMLMDLFFSAVPFSTKKRVHFHDFMRDVHARIHKHRTAFREGKVKTEDPIPPVASEIGSNLRLLCFDEFVVTDIADAMILSRLFSEFFRMGITTIATSNIEPSGLYKDGINRASFLPFVDLLCAHVDVVSLDSQTDYRQEKRDAGAMWFAPLGLNTKAIMQEIWEEWTKAAIDENEALNVHGRQIKLLETKAGFARTNFNQLCEKPLGAHDYLALAERYHSIVLENVPRLEADRKNEAKRLIILIDTLYEAGTRLAVSAEDEPDKLYQNSNHHEGFEFARTASRLNEMRSDAWLAQWQNKNTQK